MSVLFLIVASSLVVVEINGYGRGAPAFKCNDMLPSHSGIQPVNTPSPYTISTNFNTYKQGDTITVTLQSTNGAAIKGFLVAAKDRNTFRTIQGRFVNVATGQVLNCGSSNAGAATQVNGQQKFSVQMQWQPTADTLGSVVFLATVVESYTTFWINIQSPEVSQAVEATQPIVTTTVAPKVTTAAHLPEVMTVTTKATTSTRTPTTSTSTTTTITTKTTEAPSTGALSTDKDCGATKGCFVKCSGASCDYIVSWRDNVDTIDFEMSSKLPDINNKWIAIAFSTDLKMGDDEVVACFNVGGTTAIERSFNRGKTNQPVPSEATLGLSNMVVEVQNGVIKCSFSKQKRMSRQKRQASSSLYVDLNNDFNVMFGTGPASPGNGINMHSINPDVTPGKVDFQSVSVIGDTAKYPLIKIHACLMIIAWIFCTGVGILAARYYKPVWSKSSLFSQKIWFQIHRTLMVSAMVLTIVAFIIIFVEVGGYSEIIASPGKEYLPAHPILGIIVTILCIVNPIMSYFRPGPTDKKRPLFNWAHWGVGMVAQILSIITIIFGVELQKSTAPKYTIWVVVGFVIYYIVMEITQKLLDRMADKKSEGQIDSVEMKQNGASMQPPAYSESDKNRKDTLLKKSLLALHGICTLAFTLTLVLLVSMY